MGNIAWMAWTWQGALFFVFIATGLIILTLLAIYRPEVERIGILRIPTTRGDRFFISLLTAAFLHLAWIGFLGPDFLWGASIVSCLLGALIFSLV